MLEKWLATAISSWCASQRKLFNGAVARSVYGIELPCAGADGSYIIVGWSPLIGRNVPPNVLGNKASCQEIDEGGVRIFQCETNGVVIQFFYNDSLKAGIERTVDVLVGDAREGKKN